MSVIVFYNSSHSHTYICYVLHIKIYLHISEVHPNFGLVNLGLMKFSV